VIPSNDHPTWSDGSVNMADHRAVRLTVLDAVQQVSVGVRIADAQICLSLRRDDV
jgi:hypothetical protein